jgi:hypothetical protein
MAWIGQADVICFTDSHFYKFLCKIVYQICHHIFMGKYCASVVKQNPLSLLNMDLLCIVIMTVYKFEHNIL